MSRFIIRKSAILLILVVLMMMLLKYIARDTADQKIKNDPKFEFKLDSLQHELEASRVRTDSLILRLDSIRSDNENLSVAVAFKDAQIAKIKSRYKDVPQDSLGKLMNARASNR